MGQKPADKKAKGKKKAKGTVITALQSEEEVLTATRGEADPALSRAVFFGERARLTSNGVREEYVAEKEALGDAVPPRKVTKAVKAPRPEVVVADGFTIKPLPPDAKLDAPFASRPPPGLATDKCKLLRLVSCLLGVDNVFTSRLESAPECEIPYKGKVQELFKDPMRVHEVKEKYRSEKTGKNSVNDDALKEFKRAGCQVAAGILDLRTREKMLSTYYEDQSSGMMALVHDGDSCLHHELVHNRTTTGRLSSANPNCQNIPKDEAVRELFISRFTTNDEQGICIESDYSQLEVITLAVLARDKQMIQDLKNKVDFHCKRVTMINPALTYDEVVQKAKKEKVPEYVKMRQQAKVFSFQRQYGAGVRMLSESTGLAPDTIKGLIERERAIYADCDQFYSLVEHSARLYEPSIQDGKRTARGEVMLKGLFPALTGSRYVFTESEVPKVMLDRMAPGEKTTSFSPPHLKNYPVQGFAGEIVQIMLGRVWRHYLANDNYGGDALLTNTVHDCVWVDAKAPIAEQVADDLGRLLAAVPETFKEFFPDIPIECAFPTDTVVGATMGDLHPIEAFDFEKAQPVKK